MDEFDDLDSDGYYEDDNIESFEKKMIFYESEYKIEDEQTGFQSRAAHFSSYKQFPSRQQVNPKAGPGSGNMESQQDSDNKINTVRTKRVYGR